MGVYAQHAAAYAAAGLPVFPVDTRNKRPAVRGWQNASPRTARGWAANEKLAAADGLGIVMGRPSGITEVDVDAAGEAWIGAAVERFGETPIVIRTASGKAKLWYRHTGEGRHIRPLEGLPIDVLGGGFTIAPPSWRDDLGAAYAFVTGGLDAVRALPPIRADALSEGVHRAPEAVQRGERNDSAWRYAMVQARFCDDVETLIDAVQTWADDFPEPLHPMEVERCARSAWGYQISGRNYLGLKKPQITRGDVLMDALIAQPEALVLLQMFERWHNGRPSFAIAPTAMSKAGSPPWPRRKIERARDVLVEKGYLEQISPPDGRSGRAGRYCLRGVGRTANNHNTPSTSPWGTEQ